VMLKPALQHLLSSSTLSIDGVTDEPVTSSVRDLGIYLSRQDYDNGVCWQAYLSPCLPTLVGTECVCMNDFS